MAGRTPGAAIGDSIAPLQESLGCICHARFTLRDRAMLRVGGHYSVALNGMRPVRLIAARPLWLTAGQTVRLLRTEDMDESRGQYGLSTVSYVYALSVPNSGGDGVEEALSFHWTAEAAAATQVVFPHLHVGSALVAGQTVLRPGDLHKAHIPTGRVSIEAVVRLAIAEFGVEPRHPRWQEVLARNEADFQRRRTR